MAAVAAFDFTDLEEYCSRDSSYADHFLTTLLGEDRINNLNSTAGGGNYNQFWSIQSLVNTGNIRNLPKIGFYVTLAVAYVVLAGPGLYFFLKQRNLREYYQPSVALLAICTTGMVIIMGSGTAFPVRFSLMPRLKIPVEQINQKPPSLICGRLIIKPIQWD